MAIQTIRLKIDEVTTTLTLKEKFVGKEVMITITDVLPKEKKKYTKDGKFIRPIKRKTSSFENLLISDPKIIKKTDLILKKMQPFQKDIDILGDSTDND